MVRKMAAHGGRAIGTADKTGSDIVSGAKRKAGAAEEKKPRRNPRTAAARALSGEGRVRMTTNDDERTTRPTSRDCRF